MDTKGIFRCWPSSFKTTICLQKNLEKCKQVILEKPQKITLTPKLSAKSVTRVAFSNRFPCGWPFCMGHANEPAICIIITSMIIIIYTYLGRGNSEAPNRTDKIENLRSSICHVQFHGNWKRSLTNRKVLETETIPGIYCASTLFIIHEWAEIKTVS